MSMGFMEMGLVFGVVLAFAIYELVAVRRSLRRDKSSQERTSMAARENDSTPLNPKQDGTGDT